jgi:hypothetical protein
MYISYLLEKLFEVTSENHLNFVLRLNLYESYFDNVKCHLTLTLIWKYENNYFFRVFDI